MVMPIDDDMETLLMETFRSNKLRMTSQRGKEMLAELKPKHFDPFYLGYTDDEE